MSMHDTTIRDLTQYYRTHEIIYTFRNFLYKINPDIRYHCFTICKRYLENEYHNDYLCTTEKENIQNLLNHWQYTAFQDTPVNWWSTLCNDHSHSTSLMTLLQLWITIANYSETLVSG